MNEREREREREREGFNLYLLSLLSSMWRQGLFSQRSFLQKEAVQALESYFRTVRKIHMTVTLEDTGRPLYG